MKKKSNAGLYWLLIFMFLIFELQVAFVYLELKKLISFYPTETVEVSDENYVIGSGE